MVSARPPDTMKSAMGAKYIGSSDVNNFFAVLTVSA